MTAIVPVAAVATLVGVGIAGALSVAFTGVGFAAIVPGLVFERVILAAVLGPAVLGVAFVVREGDHVTGVPDRQTSVRRWLGAVTAVGLVGIGWIVGATLFSLVRRDVFAFPTVGEAIVGAVPAPIDGAVRFATAPQGWILYLVGAAGALALVALALGLRGDRLPVPRRPVTYRDDN